MPPDWVVLLAATRLISVRLFTYLSGLIAVLFLVGLFLLGAAILAHHQ
jgi:hypothetical protein